MRVDRYLVELAADLRHLGAAQLADVVASACEHASRMSTEFLGESRIALRQVWSLGRGISSEQALADVADVLQQLDVALDKR